MSVTPTRKPINPAYFIMAAALVGIAMVMFVHALQGYNLQQAACDAGGGCVSVTKAKLAEALTQAYVIGHTHGEQTCKAGT